MKRAIIFHGTNSKPADFWYLWLKDQLEQEGYAVDVPHYADINRTPIDEFLPKVLDKYNFNSDTVLIGHSAGVPLILSVLENIEIMVSKAVLVAGFSEELPGTGDRDVVLQDLYNWEKIRKRADEFIIMNSDNDPWGCDDKQGKRMFDKLGGTLVIRHDGHFGSTAKGQPYKEFPLLKSLIVGDTK